MTLAFALVTAFGISPVEATTGTDEIAEDVAECGGAVVVDCNHTHTTASGSTSHYCYVYTEGSFHVGGGPSQLEVKSECLHYL